MAKILYVEDNEMNRDMLSRRLTRRGYDIIMAFDGQAGLDMMRNDSPDIVLMDMGLPVLDGWEATSQAKADGELSGIPIIALTAHAMEEDRQKALAAGATACSFGKMFLFSLGAGGQAGVEHLLQNMHDEINRNMVLMGCKSLKDLNRTKLIYRK